jgi:enoyl-CoA hydratase/carnithine racemase
MGRHRALEVILSGIDLDAVTAAQWGYLNRAMAADEIGRYVEMLARRIASFPPEAVRLAKEAVNNASKPLDEGLADESYLFQQLIRTDAAKRNMARFLEIGGQTRDIELQIGDVNAKLDSPI